MKHLDPKFPNLDVFDEISAILDTANGVCGVLAEAANSAEVGSDFGRAAYGIGYLIEAARDKLAPAHRELAHYRAGRA